MYEGKDKVVLVTGGSAGIGAGIVRAFLDEGAKHVAILDVDVTNGKALANELNSKYGSGKAKFYKCDVTSDDLDDAYAEVIKEFGYIDVVINNAGIMNDSPKMFEKAIAINVTALIRSSMKAYNLMRKDHNGKGGTILNISSIVALYRSKLLPIYTATKSAVLQFSNCLGNEPHYSRSGVRVITMCFGCTETSLFSRAKLESFDKETDSILMNSLSDTVLPFQKPESAVRGLMEAFKKGSSASTWLVSAGRPAEEITANIEKAFEIMSQGVFDKA